MVHMASYDNASTLLIACQNGHDQCVEVLLENGCDPSLPVLLYGEDTAMDALQSAVKFGHGRYMYHETKLKIRCFFIQKYRYFSYFCNKT